MIEIKCHSRKVVHPTRVAGDAVIIFDREITFEPDGTAVIWATRLDGTRIKVSVTKQYAERMWRIHFSEEEVQRLIWVYIDDFRAAAARAHAAGRKELTL